jgi:hypothetical protein
MGKLLCVKINATSCRFPSGIGGGGDIGRIGVDLLRERWSTQRADEPSLGWSGVETAEVSLTDISVVYVSNSGGVMEIGERDGELFARLRKDDLVFSSNETQCFSGAAPYVYSSGNFRQLVELSKTGKVSLLGGMISHDGRNFQQFRDSGMTTSDWQKIGFRAPEDAGPALDSGGSGKGLAQRFVCVPYQYLPEILEHCEEPWGCFVDSSHEGVFFSSLRVLRESHNGFLAGIGAGSRITFSHDFTPGAPFRASWSGIRTADGEALPQRDHQVALYLSGQYISIDPHAKPFKEDIRARWMGNGRLESGVFAEAGKYSPARQIRRTHYVPPRLKPLAVWERGKGVLDSKCVLDPSHGGDYTPRPPRGQYSKLVEKYGRDAVPRNFQKYTEAQISKRSSLLKLVGDGTWVYIPDQQAAGGMDSVLRSAYDKNFPGQWLSCRVLRMLDDGGGVERDPIRDGVFVRLITRREAFSDPKLTKKLMRAMSVDGWGFLTEEILSNQGQLRAHFLGATLT